MNYHITMAGRNRVKLWQDGYDTVVLSLEQFAGRLSPGLPPERFNALTKAHNYLLRHISVNKNIHTYTKSKVNS